VLNYLQQLKERGVLDSSVVIFFSDHGIRWGEIRNFFTGYFEERLPFFYIWLPEKFEKAHPDFVRNLRINRDRLSVPYDVHLTLKHILQLSGGYNISYVPSAVSCPKCQSLFEEISFNRSCAEAEIDKHWCTCVQFKEFDETSDVIALVVNYVIRKLNADVSAYPKCASLYLNEIYSARTSSDGSFIDYFVSFDVLPSKAKFETTVRCDKDCANPEIMGSVSRINRYGSDGNCIKDRSLRKYCFCQ